MKTYLKKKKSLKKRKGQTILFSSGGLSLYQGKPQKCRIFYMHLFINKYTLENNILTTLTDCLDKVKVLQGTKRVGK